MRYILADELNCFPPEPVEAELERLGVSYVALLERIATVLAAKPLLLFREVARCIPAYWSVHVKDLYPTGVQQALLETLRAPTPEAIATWERLAPYAFKKAATMATETLVYDRLPWVLALLRNWHTLPPAPEDRPAPATRKHPVLGVVLEGLQLMNKVQRLAVEAAQKDAASRGERVPFGDMCVRKGFVTAPQLAEALRIQDEIAVALDSPKRLGLYLLEVGVVTPTQLRDALAEHRRGGMPLGQVLVQQGALAPDLLETVLGLQRQDRIAAWLVS
ncbi:MAG: hypothetical protein VKQ33_11885 [Candidatus Sericytochromatia bacterium]|nr:hypothetical protein [Candidatus Sericytochromatia bacterium]